MNSSKPLGSPQLNDMVNALTAFSRAARPAGEPVNLAGHQRVRADAPALDASPWAWVAWGTDDTAFSTFFWNLCLNAPAPVWKEFLGQSAHRAVSVAEGDGNMTMNRVIHEAIEAAKASNAKAFERMEALLVNPAWASAFGADRRAPAAGRLGEQLLARGLELGYEPALRLASRIEGPLVLAIQEAKKNAQPHAFDSWQRELLSLALHICASGALEREGEGALACARIAKALLALPTIKESHSYIAEHAIARGEPNARAAVALGLTPCGMKELRERVGSSGHAKDPAAQQRDARIMISAWRMGWVSASQLSALERRCVSSGSAEQAALLSQELLRAQTLASERKASPPRPPRI